MSTDPDGEVVVAYREFVGTGNLVLSSQLGLEQHDVRVVVADRRVKPDVEEGYLHNGETARHQAQHGQDERRSVTEGYKS